MSKSDVDLIAKAVTNLSKQSPSGGVSDEDIQKIIDGLKSEDVVSLKDRIEYMPNVNPPAIGVKPISKETYNDPIAYQYMNGSIPAILPFKLKKDKLVTGNIKGVKVDFDVKLVFYYIKNVNAYNYLFGHPDYLLKSANSSLHIIKNFEDEVPDFGYSIPLGVYIPEYDQIYIEKDDLLSESVIYKSFDCVPYLRNLGTSSFKEMLAGNEINGWGMHKNFLYAFYETDYVAVNAGGNNVELTKPLTAGSIGNIFTNSIVYPASWECYSLGNTRRIVNISPAKKLMIGFEYDQKEEVLKLHIPVSAYNFGLSAANSTTGTGIAYVAAPNKIQYVI